MSNVINDINQEIFNETEGKIGVRNNHPNNDDDSKVRSTAEAVGSYAVQSLKDDNNTIYENQQKFRRIESVTSVVIADFVTHKQQAMYDRLDMNNKDTKDFLSSIGYGYSAQNLANSTLSQGFVGTVMINGQPRSIGASTITSAERASLKETGQFKRDVDGREVLFKAKEVSTENIRKILNAADNEAERNNRVMNAHGQSDRVKAINELRHASLNKMKAEGIDVGHGTRRDLGKAKKELETKLQSALESGDHVKAATIQNQIHKIDKHQEMFGGTDEASGNRGSNKQMGMRIISRGILGSDMMTGIDTTRRTYKVTSLAVKTAVRATSSVAYGAQVALSNIYSNPVLDKALNSHRSFRENAKMKHDAKKNGTMRDYKSYKKEKKTNAKIERREERDKRFESKQSRLRNNGETEKASRRQTRHDKKKEFQGAVAGFKTNASGKWRSFANKFGVLRDKVRNNFLLKAIRMPFDAVGAVKAFISKHIIMPVIIGVGSLLGIVVLISVIVNSLAYGVKFLSESIRTDLWGELNNVNYVQLIVDDVSDTLGSGFLNVAKRDAERHYLNLDDENGAVPSNGVAWFKAPTNGELRGIYSSEEGEDGRSLSSVNANVLPIVSAMHMRYEDDLDYEHWLTARGYTYYLYVATHNVAGYDYEDAGDCADTALYEGDILWNVHERTLLRPFHELCTNVYIHGYDCDLNKNINQARAAGTEALNLAMSYLNLSFEFDSSSYGVFDEIPHDAVGECDHYKPVQAGDREGTNPESENVDNTCGYLEHVHTAACYTLTCKVPEHSHGDGTCNTENCSHVHDSNCCNIPPHIHSAACGEEHCGRCSKLLTECTCTWRNYTWFSDEHCQGGHIHGDGTCNTDACHHIHDGECCSKEEHTHLSGPAQDYTSSSDTDYNECWHLTCGKPAHLHKEWTVEDHGCWKTKYICLGHCGGHIIPQIDVVMDMSFENIVAKDYFKTVYFLAESDFSSNWLAEALAAQDIKSWRGYWELKMASWFFPFPSSPAAAIENYAKMCIANTAQGIDKLTGWISGLFGGSEEDVVESIEDDAGIDLYGFTGWYSEDGTLDESLIRELEDFYGQYEDNYSTGVLAWKDFDVLFPTGICRPLSQEQTESVLSQIMERRPNLSEKRQSVIASALNSVGQYWYDLSSKTGGMYSTSGRIDSSGFVSGVLYRAIQWDNDWNEAQFGSAGYAFDGDVQSLIPGDILVLDDSSTWEVGRGWSNGKNHVVIYLGFLPQGLEDYMNAGNGGFYVIDCSSKKGGSTIRKVSTSTIENYGYVYRGCY